MQHQFNIDLATEYGVEVAIIVNNFDFWLQHNAANNRNIIDGKPWTYNSAAALSQLFPYWSESQIRRILHKMVESGIIETGNHNKAAYDRTLWYTFTDSFIEKHSAILRFASIHVTKSSNESNEIVTPIPDINTDIKPDKSLSRAKKTRDIAPMTSPTARMIEESVTAIQPIETWSSIPKERSCILKLATKIEALTTKTPIQDAAELAGLIIKTFVEKKRSTRQSYWSDAPVIPSAILARLPELAASIATRYSAYEQASQFDMEVPF
jgi:hypothetical protein